MATKLEMATHQFRRDPHTRQMVKDKEMHYVRITQGGNPPLFIQNGNLFGANGVLVEEVPDWVVEQIKTLTPACRESVKADVLLPKEKEESPKPKQEKVEVKQEIVEPKEDSTGQIFKSTTKSKIKE